MEDFPGLLAQDFGFRPQGKSAPMSRPRNAGLGSGVPNSARSSLGKTSPIVDDRAHGKDGMLFNDVFGGPPKYSESRSGGSAPMSEFDYDSIFKELNPKSLPVFDVPVYDDDVFDGLPGLKNAADGSSVIFDDVFSTRSASSPKHGVQAGAKIDELLGSFGKIDKESRAESVTMDKNSPAFADLLPGFGRSGLPSFSRSTSGSGPSKKSFANSDKITERAEEDPFEILEPHPNRGPSSSEFMEPSEKISKLSSYGSKKEDNSSVNRGRLNGLDPFENLGVLPVSHKNGDEENPTKTRATMVGEAYHSSRDPVDKHLVDHSKSHLERMMQRDTFRDSYESFFDMQSSSPVGCQETNSPSRLKEPSETSDLAWLTVREIPLFTQITSAPPPSRPPPPKSSQIQKQDIHSFSSLRLRTKVPESSSSSHCQSPKEALPTSQIAELEDFAMGRVQSSVNELEEDPYVDDMDATSAAASAAMKEAMDKAEAKLKQMREKEHLKHARSKEAAALFDKDVQDAQQRESREKQEREREQREKEEEEREQRRHQREMEEREKEQRRLERERERAREIEREREIARLAVERATREARERAAAEARLKAERAAVEKVAAEARERAERVAVQRAQAEARERAEKAAAEAREKEMRARAESRQRAERAAVERAAAEARERAAAAALANMQKNEQRTENDLESFFSSRSNSTPIPKPNSATDSFFDAHSKSGTGSETVRRPFAGPTATMKKASSVTNIVDDLSSMFGAGTAAASSTEFHEVEGETEDRRKARLHRFQRTQERAANALAEKNQRDLQAQKDQAERHRVAETLDVEIRRWATGKEGNLRALLSTLQYVLWSESGWQPVSLTDLITAAAVKKVYRKATLCIHPDKVQQKGANLQQKYIAEKVFDLLKEAWNKFNSEELF